MALIAMYAVDEISFLTSADRFVQDWEIATRSPVEPQDPNILVVAIDEGVMQHFPYRSPLDRGFIAALLTALDAKHPKAIFLDYLFDQPTEPIKDAMLRGVLRGMKTPLVVSYSSPATKSAATRSGISMTSCRRAPGRLRISAPIRPTRRAGFIRAARLHRRISDERAAQVGHYRRRANAERAGSDYLALQRPAKNQPAFAQDPGLRLGACCLHADCIDPAGRFVPEQDRHGRIRSSPWSIATAPPSPPIPRVRTRPLPGVVILANATAQLLEGRDPPQLEWWNNFLIALAMAGVGAGARPGGILSLAACRRGRRPDRGAVGLGRVRSV